MINNDKLNIIKFSIGNNPFKFLESFKSCFINCDEEIISSIMARNHYFSASFDLQLLPILNNNDYEKFKVEFIKM